MEQVRVELTSGQDTPIGWVLNNLYYGNSSLYSLAPSPVGYPHNGGEHALSITGTREDVVAYLDLLVENYLPRSTPTHNAVTPGGSPSIAATKYRDACAQLQRMSKAIVEGDKSSYKAKDFASIWNEYPTFKPPKKDVDPIAYAVQDQTLDCDCCYIEAYWHEGGWWIYGTLHSLRVRKEVTGVRRWTTPDKIGKCEDRDCQHCHAGAETEAKKEPSGEFEFTFDNPQWVPVECKGLFYRFRRSTWKGRDGSLNYKDSFRPLRSLSCPGCDDCGSISDSIDMLELNIGYPNNLKGGELLKAKISNVHRDWETGQVDDWDVELEVVAEEKKNADS